MDVNDKLDSSYKEFKPLENILEAASLLQCYFSITRQHALDILAKSLLFKSFNHFEYFLEERGERDMFYVNGLYYSEYILAEELKIPHEVSLVLKGKIDKIHFNNSGHIFYSSPLSISSYLKNEESKFQSISTKCPISIYFRGERLGLIFMHDNNLKIENFWVKYIDEIYVPEQYLGYFLGRQKNINQSVCSIFRDVLQNNNLVFPHYFLDTMKNSYKEIYVEFFVEFGFKIHNIADFGYDYYLITHDRMLLNFLGKKEVHMNLMEKAAFKLQIYRTKAGLTQKDLADKSDIGVRTIGYIESGNRLPSFEILSLLAKGLDIDVKDFF